MKRKASSAVLLNGLLGISAEEAESILSLAPLTASKADINKRDAS